MRNVVFWFGAMIAGMALAANSEAAAPERPQIGIYYFPNYHPSDARNQKSKGAGWSEWKLVKTAKPRFEGHHQPNVPLWGYTDESDPKQMAQKIDAAADHGIDAFIFDWYYYEDGLFLERGLEQGFMKAANNNRMKFALMWANHDWTEIHPAYLNKPHQLLYPGKISPETFDKMTDYIIKIYFKHTSHWMIDGKPYFSVYDQTKLIEIFGSIQATRAALDRFREKTKAAGFPGLHLNAVMWGRTILPGEKAAKNPVEVVKGLGYDTVGSYVWVHHAVIQGFPTGKYEQLQKSYFDYAKKAFTMYGVPYYPNVSMGWDSSPRTDQSGPFENKGYPYCSILTGNTPAAFKGALIEMKALLAARPASERVFTINSWNEWTEGSYLEPDTVNKLGYLEAVRDVFDTAQTPK
ncbi:MAG: glycoside hydrolase family 99-like domain-containing protein [Candidatus Sumerlaeota bacterium]|nr:glycoside hydrolase family 99-like domain-containing protein [Candidatus Sumerlaeota bacterium]